MAYDFRTDPRLTREQKLFLSQHPTLAKLEPGSQAWRQFLVAHPGTAEQYRNTVILKGQTVSGTGTPAGGTPAGGTPTTVTTPPQPTEPTDRELRAGNLSARAIVEGTLAQYGLNTQDLAGWAWNRFIDTGDTAIVFHELRGRPEYAARFPGMKALSDRGQAITEGAYIGLEAGYRSQMRAYGLPESFYDAPDDFGNFMANNVSAQEFGDRLALAEQASLNDPRAQMMRDELSRMYGLPNAQGAMTAIFIDPDRALGILKQQVAASLTAGASRRSGFGSLTVGEAERISGLGVSEEQAGRTFGSLAGMNEFGYALPGDTDDRVSREELLQAGFENNADAQRKIARTGERRTAGFRGGGGYATSARGVSGLGSART